MSKHNLHIVVEQTTKGGGEIAGDGWVEGLVIIFLYYLYCFIAVIKPDNLAFQKKNPSPSRL